MYGVELQVSGNVFDKVKGQAGVQERDVAFERAGWKITLEGDEATTPDATAELEFVTAPCSTPAELQTAVGNAKLLAEALLTYATQHGWRNGDGLFADFKANQAFLDGAWKQDCRVRITDEVFRAQMQVTVGVPLRALRTFIETVLTRTDVNSAKDGSDLALVRLSLAEIRTVRPHASEELQGFVAACALFLIQGIPSVDRYLFTGKLHRMEAVFDFSGNEYIGHYGGLEPSPFKDSDGRYLVVIDRDSPKSLFSLLPRTDFHSMFLGLPKEDQDFLLSTKPEKVWPLIHDLNNVHLFPLPYRADPLANDLKVRGFADLATTRNPTQTGPDVLNEPWTTVLHGPKVVDWWTSVLKGDPNRGILKDMASPPPGFRGRAPNRIANFPQPDENKKNYYGMGAFPMDPSGKIPLAVFEIRNFMSDRVLNGMEPKLDEWQTAVGIFIEHYLPALGEH